MLDPRYCHVPFCVYDIEETAFSESLRSMSEKSSFSHLQTRLFARYSSFVLLYKGRLRQDKGVTTSQWNETNR